MISAKIKDYIKSAIPDSLMLHKLPKKAGSSIVLTFDDGPDSSITPQILKLLKKYQVRAVFFVVGCKIKESPAVFDKIVAEGHVIGNHTYNHPNRIISSTDEFYQEILLCDELIKEKTGETPNLIRPPLGLSFAALRVARTLEKRIVLWSNEGGECGIHRQKSAEFMKTRLVKTLKAQDILLLHDNNNKTIQIINGILPFLKHQKIDLTTGVNSLLS